MSREAAIKALGVILSSYPSANREGIENFYKLAVESLSEFPSEILAALAHPKTGIVAKSTFIPSIAELRAFCNDEIGRRHRIAVWEQQEEARKLHAPERIEDPVIHAKVMSGLRRLSEELGRKREDNLLTVEEAKAKAERWLDQQAELAKTNAAPQLSPELREKLNLP